MGTLTINTAASQDARISGAFGKRLNLGRGATAHEVKQQVIMFLVNVVQEYERLDVIAAAQAGLPAPIDPT